MTKETIKYMVKCILLGEPIYTYKIPREEHPDITKWLNSHPVMQEGKFVQWAEDRLPVDDEQPEPIKPNSVEGLNEAINKHPDGGSYVVISDNPFHQPLRFAWCQSITPRSNPSQDLDTHSSNLL